MTVIFWTVSVPNKVRNDNQQDKSQVFWFCEPAGYGTLWHKNGEP
jgi:hypothetical protein